MSKYSLSKGFTKTVINVLIVSLPLIIDILPTDIANITLSGAILMLINYLKVISK